MKQKPEWNDIIQTLSDLITALQRSHKLAAADYFTEVSQLIINRNRQYGKLTLKYLGFSTQLFQFHQFTGDEQEIYERLLAEAVILGE